jgi:hypothetical protein
MASGILVEETEAEEECDICMDTLGLCKIEFDDWEETWVCSGVEDEPRCWGCLLLAEDE